MSHPTKGRVIVTCGPSYEPIDEVRRITNQSTGKLGLLLSNHLARAGWEVLCLKGVAATHHEPLEAGVERVPFSTNEHLLERLLAAPEREGITAVFHAAALCDFKVKQITGADGGLLDGPKLSSRAGELVLVLEPAKKVIGELRALFPRAKLVGWKYELAGTREETLAKAARQMAENHTDVCIANGTAYGRGFGVMVNGRPVLDFPGREALCEWLASWLEAGRGTARP
jgi:phosphopantothenoylcysteine synthetase/decarboxylase